MAILFYAATAPEPLPPTYPSYYAALATSDVGLTDYIDYGNAGDDIHQHTDYWGVFYGTPFYTGQSITLQTGSTEGAVKSWGLKYPYDIKLYFTGIVFSFPANYAYISVQFRRSGGDTTWIQARLGSTYPYDIFIQGKVGIYTGSYTANVGTLDEVQGGNIAFRFLADENGDGGVYFFNDNLSDWQLIRGTGTYKMSGASHITPYVYVSNDTSNPSLTVSISNFIVDEATDAVPWVYRLGNHTWRRVETRFHPLTLFEATTTSGLIMKDENESDSFMVSDPPFLSGAADGEEGDLWTLETAYETIRPGADQRYGVYFEIGHFPIRGYADGDSAYYDNSGSPGNYHFGRNQTSAVRLEHNTTYARIYYKAWNDSGVISVNNYVGGYGNTDSGTFKCVHEGYNVYKLYFKDNLIYTWEPTAWDLAGQADNRMYVALGYSEGYANADIRWLKCELI